MEEILSWSFWSDSVTGSIHFGLALLCLILGPIVLVRRKGNKTHRILGSIWAASMLILNISALSMYGINGRPTLFHFFAIVSFATLIPGYYAIWRFKTSRNPAHLLQHRYCMVWAYFGLAAAGVWQMALTVLMQLGGKSHYGLALNGLGVLTGLIAFGLNRYLNKKYPGSA